MRWVFFLDSLAVFAWIEELVCFFKHQVVDYSGRIALFLYVCRSKLPIPLRSEVQWLRC